MATTKTRYFDMNTTEKGFISRLRGENKKYGFDDLKILRNLLTNEKAKILQTLKTQSPESIYQLAKILKKDLKSIRRDVKILEKFGFIDFVSKKNGKRISYSPVLVVNRMEFILNI